MSKYLVVFERTRGDGMHYCEVEAKNEEAAVDKALDEVFPDFERNPWGGLELEIQLIRNTLVTKVAE